DNIDTAISSLSMGTSHYATECLVAALKDTPYDTGLDMNLLTEIAAYFADVKKHYAKYESDFKGVDIKILESQIPGGMITNMENQLREQNALDKLQEVLKEVPRVRKDMGYPPLVTPTSQIVGSQATLNVLTGERYKIITKETRECVLGKYGKLPGPLDEDLLAKCTENEEVIDCRPADLLEPEWDRICEELGDSVTSEGDRLSYAMFPKVALKFFETRGQPAPEAPPPPAKPAKEPAAPERSAAPAAVPPAGGEDRMVFNVRVNGRDYSVEVSTSGAGAPAPAAAPPASSAPAPASTPAGSAPSSNEQGTAITASLPGSVFSIKCQVGDTVNPEDTLMILESMKMETEVKSHIGGTVQSIKVKEGDNIKTGDELVVIG
ncbi:MAG: pyruvate carboxylase subunit B, partial [Nitrospinaceae bacterium]|nr:pyruvate carboxylase subunit B [Nitrospinaceae bacterium]NIS87161.1 pyruvate carboxylase subunit B [Nitrospinaceae bacterium]NIT81867.1 pyruvate carboxylase subunit B [Nitrospinaceae bacterium]NIU96251.1 pyruvate carboxylase subunit B [Nitrospinaceae bacterium]NIY15053.1 pyruvate carboxylase subunit B [Nitrospinaceae bacterium]